MTEIERTPFEEMSRMYSLFGEDWVRHFACETEVQWPTISVVDLDDDRRAVAVQWFSQAIAGDLPIGVQTKFHLMTRVDDIHWFGKPEDFKVLFLGKLKDWPNPDAAQGLADQLSEGSLDAWVVAVVNPDIMMGHEDSHPHTFISRLILVGDQEAGLLIAPETHSRTLEQITEPEPHFVLPKTKR